ncbi:MAG: HAD family hydrolase [Trueperaceae bacterium]|nr:MAG: HAD family hydrolase [Trueperaceae bacterium]
MALRGVIFDVGGTLVWSNFDYFERANAWSAANTLCSGGFLEEPTPFFQALLELRATSSKEGSGFTQIGTTREHLAQVTRELGVLLSEDSLTELESAFVRTEACGAVSLSGIENVVRGLSSRVRLAVVSNTRSHLLIEEIVRGLGLRDLFDPFVTSVSCGFRKPSPQIFNKVLNAWHFDPAEVVMIGNSLRKDVAGAKALGIRTIWLKADAREEVEAEPDAVAETPDDILKILMSWDPSLRELTLEHVSG